MLYTLPTTPSHPSIPVAMVTPPRINRLSAQHSAHTTGFLKSPQRIKLSLGLIIPQGLAVRRDLLGAVATRRDRCRKWFLWPGQFRLRIFRETFWVLGRRNMKNIYWDRKQPRYYSSKDQIFWVLRIWSRYNLSRGVRSFELVEFNLEKKYN